MKDNILVDARSYGEITRTERGIEFKDFICSSLPAAKRQSSSLDASNDKTLYFKSEQAFEKYLLKQPQIDTWEIRDTETQQIIYKHQFDGEIETFHSERSLNSVLSRECNGAWQVDYQTSNPELKGYYVLTQSGWFSTTYQKYSLQQENEFEDAYTQSQIQKTQNAKWLGLGLLGLNLSAFVASVLPNNSSNLKNNSAETKSRDQLQQQNRNYFPELFEFFPAQTTTSFSTTLLLGACVSQQTRQPSTGLFVGLSSWYLSHAGVNAEDAAPIIDLGNLTPEQGMVLVGEAGIEAGISVSTAGDVNQDGKADFLVGAYGANSLDGKAYLIYGAGSLPQTIYLGSLNASQGVVLVGEAGARSNAGYSVSTAGDVNQDGNSDFLVGAPEAGKAYLIYGAGSLPQTINLGSLNASQGMVLVGEAGSYAGWSVSTAGDVNQDGKADFLVGAFNGAGTAYLIYGAGSLPQTINLGSLNASQGVVLVGEVGSRAGISVSTAGDVNQDGNADFLVGAYYANSQAGKAYLIYGAGSLPQTINLGSLNASQGVVLVSEGGSGAGISVSTAGDVNQDGKSDFLVGAYNATSGAGKAYLIYGAGSLPQTINLGSLNASQGMVLVGEAGGSSVSTAGDVNQDGKADFLVGAYYANSGAGKVYLIYGAGSLPQTINLGSLNASQGMVLVGEAYSQAGRSVSTAGDVNQDGKSDFLVGAHYAGKAYLIYGPVEIPSAPTTAAAPTAPALMVTTTSTPGQPTTTASSTAAAPGPGGSDTTYAPATTPVSNTSNTLPTPSSTPTRKTTTIKPSTHNINATIQEDASNSSTNLPTATIAGSVAGGLALLLSTFTALCFILKARKKSVTSNANPHSPRTNRALTHEGITNHAYSLSTVTPTKTKYRSRQLSARPKSPRAHELSSPRQQHKKTRSFETDIPAETVALAIALSNPLSTSNSRVYTTEDSMYSAQGSTHAYLTGSSSLRAHTTPHLPSSSDDITPPASLLSPPTDSSQQQPPSRIPPNYAALPKQYGVAPKAIGLINAAVNSYFVLNRAEASFYHDINSADAEKCLESQPIGLFLFRPSRQEGWIAVSYVDNDKTIKSAALQFVDEQWIDSTQAVYPDLQTYLSRHAMLKTPVPTVDIFSVSQRSASGRTPSRDDELKRLQIAARDIQLGEEISRGGFGVVHKAKWNGQDVAVKQLTVKALDDEKTQQDFMKEVLTMSELRSPNIVLLYGVCLEKKPYSLVMEYIPGGTLYHRLHDGQAFGWENRYTMMDEMANGLVILHGKEITHCDLKSLNVLLTKDGHAKLTDFGLSMHAETSEAGSSTQEKSGELIGTTRWMAPEQLGDNKVRPNKKTDIYSLGMVFWEMTTRKVPYAEDRNNAVVSSKIQQGTKETIPERTAEPLTNLMNQCWETDANERPTARNVVNRLEETIVRESIVAMSKIGFLGSQRTSQSSSTRTNSAALTNDPDNYATGGFMGNLVSQQQSQTDDPSQYVTGGFMSNLATAVAQP